MHNKRNQQHFFQFLSKLRTFFTSRDFLDVVTPPMVQNPGFEAHIHPFRVQGSNVGESYLQTSPEFHMKELLSGGLNKVFTVSYSFRDEPASETHRPQFLMLEWYRANEFYSKIKEDCDELINHLSDKKIITERKTVSEIFQEALNINILDFLDLNEIHQLVSKDFSKYLPGNEKLSDWSDYFYLLFLNEIEPKLKDYPAIILSEYPHRMSALSTISQKDPRVCERFELYLNGVEIANCYNEQTDVTVLKNRFKQQNSLKNELYQYSLPDPKLLFEITEKGYPKSSGIALGVERLYGQLMNQKNIFWD